MPSPADRQAEAIADVERIAEAFYETMTRPAAPGAAYGGLAVVGPAQLRDVVRDLLRRDVIRVGHRPSAERPMEGQTTIDDMTDG